MSVIKLDYSYALKFFNNHDIDTIAPLVLKAHETLHNGTGPGNEYLGWLNLPENYDRDEFDSVKAAAKKIRQDSKAFVTIGIGGSYLGAKAGIEMLSHPYRNNVGESPEMYFAGNNFSASALNGLFDVLEGKDLSVNVVSKSGTTLEPALAFRIFRKYMEKKYGKAGAAKRIYVTTDRTNGILRKMADEEGYASFVIPSDIGGRYSVLTPAGLLPLAACGVDIDAVMAGAADAVASCRKPLLDSNDCYMYAAIRNIMLESGKSIEVLANYEPSMHFFCEWWKQLFGESEGKDGKGIFPAAVDFTSDLHSMGQYLQDGIRNIFETVIFFENSGDEIIIDSTEKDEDKLNYLTGKTLGYVNEKAMEGTMMAHSDGGVPNIKFSVEARNAYCFGSMSYFFQKACAISGCMLGVNPFDQPGVESYKKNMFALIKN